MTQGCAVRKFHTEISSLALTFICKKCFNHKIYEMSKGIETISDWGHMTQSGYTMSTNQASDVQCARKSMAASECFCIRWEADIGFLSTLRFACLVYLHCIPTMSHVTPVADCVYLFLFTINSAIFFQSLIPLLPGFLPCQF